MLGIICKQKGKDKVTTNSKHNPPVAENLLNQMFLASRPGEIWLGDITCHIGRIVITCRLQGSFYCRNCWLCYGQEKEIFYNRQPIQKKLGYLSPTAFENQYY
jgi:transposase InsO family protein